MHRRNLYFKNLKIQMGDHVYINYMLHSSISMQDCEITFDYAYSSIGVRNASTFNAKNCVFMGKSNVVVSPIQIHPGSSVNIVGCRFAHHTKSCILLFPYEYDADGRDVFVKCVGNIFEDNFEYPIVMDNITRLRGKSVIRHNILEGHNGVNMNDTVDTANKIYNLVGLL
eukprot:233746_1